jgi:gamma-glutamylputrescine oxidase
MTNISYWEKDAIFGKADFLIVGGGITGLNAAIWIKSHEPSARVVVLEKGLRGDGASYRNAGFACLGSPTELLADIQTHGADTIADLVKMRWEGLALLAQRVGDQRMDLAWCGGEEIFAESDLLTYEAVLDGTSFLNTFFKEITGIPEQFSVQNKVDNSFVQVAGCIAINKEGRLHPGRMMSALDQIARDLGVHIFNGVEVRSIDESPTYITLTTDKDIAFQSHRVGIATNGFTQKLFPHLAVFPARNQVYLTEPVNGLVWDKCLHYHQGYVYARRINDRLLIGGARHLHLERESTSAEGQTADIERFLHDFVHKHFKLEKSLRFEDAWSGTLGIGAQKRPIIEQTSNNIFAAVRLGGMGIAIGTLVGDALGKLMTQQ